jgi:hypothetical protein
VLGAMVQCTGCAAHNFACNNEACRSKEAGRMILGLRSFNLVLCLEPKP